MGLARLAALHGVATAYAPSEGVTVPVPDATVVAVLAALGVDASTPRRYVTPWPAPSPPPRTGCCRRRWCCGRERRGPAPDRAPRGHDPAVARSGRR